MLCKCCPWLLQITTGAASLALAISMVAAGWPAPAPAVTPEQLLFLEVRTSSNQALHQYVYAGMLHVKSPVLDPATGMACGGPCLCGQELQRPELV